MYECNICGVRFDAPVVRRDRLWHSEVGAYEPLTEELCPVCWESDFEEMRECPKCGEPTTETGILCGSCKKSLKKRLFAFADELTEEEEQQIDDWLDGRSIMDRRCFA